MAAWKADTLLSEKGVLLSIPLVGPPPPPPFRLTPPEEGAGSVEAPPLADTWGE
jgi:hypothetical protein